MKATNGTRGHGSKRSTLNAKRFVGPALLLVAAICLGGQQRIFFRDKQGNMELTNFTSWKISRVEGTEGTYRFRAAGKPLTAKWEGQGLSARTPNLQGTAKQGADGLELIEATMTGGVHATTTRKSSNRASKEVQTVALDADTLEFDGPKNQIDLKGGVVVNQNDPGANQVMKATGNSGTVVLTPRALTGAKGPIQSAVLTGSSRIELTSKRYVTQGKPPVRALKPYNITATAARVEFRLAQSGSDYGTITLTGNVVIKGDDPLLVGDMTGVDKVVITLDKNQQPSDIEAIGEPTKTTVREAPPPARRAA